MNETGLEEQYSRLMAARCDDRAHLLPGHTGNIWATLNAETRNLFGGKFRSWDIHYLSSSFSWVDPIVIEVADRAAHMDTP
jgi:hypothetical protein